MSDVTPIQGELQAQLMAALWRLDSGTVEEVRGALPARYRGAYTTVQTVLNRLVDRGLLDRARDGRGFRYVPRITEAEYVASTLRSTLAGASAGARRAALAELYGSLPEAELDDVRALSRAATRARRTPS